MVGGIMASKDEGRVVGSSAGEENKVQIGKELQPVMGYDDSIKAA